MSSPIRSQQIQSDRANRVKYNQALLDEKLADPAYQAYLEQKKVNEQQRLADIEKSKQEVQAKWEANFRKRFPNAPIPGSAEARAYNPITIANNSGVLRPLAAVQNEAYQKTNTYDPRTKFLMPDGSIQPITSVYPEYMNNQMQKVGEEIFDYYRGAADKVKAGLAAYREAWKPAPEYDTGLSFRETIEKNIADSFAKHGMGKPTLFGSDLTWGRDAIAKKAAPILAATADVRARHKEPKFMSSLRSPAVVSFGFKDGGLGSYPYTRSHIGL